MSHTPGPTQILVFGPLNKISANWDQKELRSALHTAVNCREVPGPSVSVDRLDPKYITIPLGERSVHGIALLVRKKPTPGAFETRLHSLVPPQRGQPVDDFHRALVYLNM